MTKFITLTATTPKGSRVRVSVDRINTYREADTKWCKTAGAALSIGIGITESFLFVTETPIEIDVLIRTAR